MWDDFYDMEVAAGTVDLFGSVFGLVIVALVLLVLFFVALIVFSLLLAAIIFIGLISASISVADSVDCFKAIEPNYKGKASKLYKNKLIARMSNFAPFDNCVNFALLIWSYQLAKIQRAIHSDRKHIIKVVLIPGLIAGCALLVVINLGHLTAVGVLKLADMLRKKILKFKAVMTVC